MKKLHIAGFLIVFALFVLYPLQAHAEKNVVIDPGHGGSSSGTTGYSGASTGYYEKDFNLEMAEGLREILEKNGYNVHMTRTDDSKLAGSLHADLQARLDLAHEAIEGKNDQSIYISVHSNSLPSNPYMRGYETYYFDIDEGINETYPPDPVQIEYSPESKRLAHTMHQNILAGTPLWEGRGIIPSDLYVTRNAHMPAVLLEFGYMSNPTEEALIKTSSFQEKAAASVLKGVDEFFSVFEVYEYDGNRVKVFENKEQAIDYAKSMESAYVFDKFNQEKIYDGAVKRYGVYHSSDRSVNETFFTKDEAIAYAEDFENVRVVDNELGRVVWSDYLEKDYEVEHSSQGVIYEAYDFESAFNYAKKWKNTSVIDRNKDQVVWSNYLDEDFAVSHTEKGLMKTFYREKEAIAYAENWESTKVTHTESNKVVWSNDTPEYNYSFKTTTLAGEDRIQTAIEVSKQLYPNGLDGEKTVVLATAFEFADALSAGPLAAQLDNAPILLNRKDELSADVLKELSRLNTEKVVILGGENALSAQVENDLKQHFVVERLAGKDRIASNLEINKGLSNVEGVFVASSRSFPDALEASSIAAAHGWAIVLTDKDEISQESLNYLNGREVAILGGTAVVSEEVEETLIESNGGDQVTRLSGANRYETVAAALDYFEDDMRSSTVLAATGQNYPDALTASAISARTNAPLILVGDELNPTIEKQLSEYGSENVVDELQVIGAVIDKNSRNEMVNHLN
ncbi:cell wall-binding repeat-containing protein [Halobacillus litoralis]|uniref:cell wall-binding repeat-containing protein n=1 Tax=Halobacillus litoralis TaxID=45668 RepID=UPI001CFD0C2F|nr:cell wall-binding repeat-containing protein [Halobacillus litoralis]